MFRLVTITAVLNGWIVQVGCQTVVYQERNHLVSDLDAYLKDPGATEARFLKTSVNQAHTGGGVEVAPASPPPVRDAARQLDREFLGNFGNASESQSAGTGRATDPRG